MTQVFISYRRSDQAVAERFREKLLGWGYDVWLDVYNIPKGSHWPDEIDKGLRSSDYVVGLISPAALDSVNVKNEWDWTIVYGSKFGIELKLILIEEIDDIPMNYVRINYIYGVEDKDAAFEQLHEAIGGDLTPAEAKPADPHLDYLQALYERLNQFLAQRIIFKPKAGEEGERPEPLKLMSQSTRGAVDALFEKREEIDPLFALGGLEANEEPEIYDDFSRAFAYYDGRVLLLGQPGAGKTITLLTHARNAVVRRMQDPEQPLPILGIVPMWDSRKQPTLADWLAKSYGTPDNTADLIRDGKALLLLDGLDELGSSQPINPEKPEDGSYDPRLRFIQQLPENNQMLLTCRVTDYDAIGEKVKLKGAVTLQPMDDAQIRAYLREQPDLLQAVMSDSNLRQIVETPLLLSFFAFAYEGMNADERAKIATLEEAGDIRDAIFMKYVDERYAHEERKYKIRGEAMPFSLDEMKGILGRLAYENTSIFAKENVLTAWDFKEALSEDKIAEFQAFAMNLDLLALDTSEGEQDKDVVNYRFVHLLLRDTFVYFYALPRLRDSSLYDVFMSPASALGDLSDARAVEPLIQALHDEYAFVRSSAAGALGKLGDVRAIEPLIQALRGADSEVRSIAAWALGQLGDGAFEPLMEALRGADSEVRSIAAWTLGQLGGVRAVEPLMQALGDEDSTVRGIAAGSLGELGDARAVEPLMEALCDEDSEVRSGAARALGRLGDARAVEPLIQAFHDEDSNARSGAARALGLSTCQFGIEYPNDL